MTGIRRMVLTAMLITLGIVLPVFFHMIPAGIAGRALLPMHIPILIAGMIAGPFYGFFAGLVTPLLSSMTTGMPAAGVVVYRMMVELSVYGLVAGFSMRYIKTGRAVVNLYISLVAAMILGRVAAGVVQALFFTGGAAFSVALWVSGYFTTSVPGIILQIIIIPAIILALERGGLIPRRYPKAKGRINYNEKNV